MTVTLSKTGDRVRVMPHTDLFMRGVRYLTLDFIGKNNISGTDDQGRRHRLAIHGIGRI